MSSQISPLSAIEVAEVLGVHVNTVKRLDPAELPYFRVGRRGDRRYLRQHVLDYIEAHIVGATSALYRPDHHGDRPANGSQRRG